MFYISASNNKMEVVTKTTTTKTTVLTTSKLIKRSTTKLNTNRTHKPKSRARSKKNNRTTRIGRQSTGARGKWSEDSMKQAISAVRAGRFGLNKAAKHFNVPKATLRRHLHGSNVRAKEGLKTLGRSADLPADIEQDLVDHILLLESRLYGLTRVSLLSLAYEVAEKNNVKTRFNKETKKAGKDWLRSFLTRHPEISLRIPEPTSLARAAGFNRQRVSEFYKMLEKLVSDENLTAERIYNMDETGFSMVQKPQKVFARRGKHQVGAITSCERGRNVTFVCCANAAGHYVPPLVIYPRKRMKIELTEGAPAGSIFECQENGWINSELFVVWLEHFISCAKPSTERKILLVLDGHVSHTQNITALIRAREVGLILLSLPPHCTHRLQPLDLTFFKPLSSNYNQCIDRWMRANPGVSVGEQKITQFVGEAYGKAASVATAVNGFRAAGIWPVNPHVIDDIEFAPSDVTERPLASPVAENNSPSSFKYVELLCVTEDGRELPSLQIPTVDEAALVKNTVLTTPVPHVEIACSSQSFGTPFVPPVKRAGNRISAALISPVPVRRSVGLSVRKRTSLGATVLTSSPYKASLEDKMSKKNNKKVGLKKRSTVTSIEGTVEVASNNEGSVSDQGNKSTVRLKRVKKTSKMHLIKNPQRRWKTPNKEGRVKHCETVANNPSTSNQQKAGGFKLSFNRNIALILFDCMCFMIV